MSGPNGESQEPEHMQGLGDEFETWLKRVKAKLSSPFHGGFGKSPDLRVENCNQGMSWGRKVLIPLIEAKVAELKLFLEELEERKIGYAQKNNVSLKSC